MRQGFHTGEARARQRCGGDAAKTQEVCGGDAVEWAQASGWRAARDVARQCAAAWAGIGGCYLRWPSGESAWERSFSRAMESMS